MPTVQCLIRNGPQLLMIRRAEGKTQAGNLLPIAGHIEVGETPIEACIREVEEEAGYTVSPRAVGVVFNVVEGKHTDYTFLFLAEAPDADPKPWCAEGTLEWVDIDQLPMRGDVPPLDRELLPMLLSAPRPLWITLDVDTDGEQFVRRLRRVDEMRV